MSVSACGRTEHRPAVEVGEGDGEDRVLLQGVRQGLYEAIDAARGDRSVPRLAWLDEELELMSPSPLHDSIAELLSDLVKIVARALRVPYRSLRSTTWKRLGLPHGKEADACFYIANAPAVRGLKNFDLGVHSPPDLVIEVEISPPRVDVERLYAGLGVPELWRCDGRRLRMSRLGSDGRYVDHERSLGLPPLRAAEVMAWIERAATMGDPDWSDAVERWAREELAGRAGGIDPA